jgi:hypothetical protein
MNSKQFIERCLYVIGNPNAGKSVQLRSMFLDHRFGSNGQIPVKAKIRETIRLSNERLLYFRLTSPHERKETLQVFLDKIKDKIQSESGRWNVAGALQPEPAGKMPELYDIIYKLYSRFSPERIRLCFLSPDRHGNSMPNEYITQIIPRVQQIPGTETVFIDSRPREINGLFLADFFDFT